MGKEVISENVSKNGDAPKRGRGRPARFNEYDMAYVKLNFLEIKTHRGRVNRNYAIRAIAVLDYESGLEWLCSTKEAIMAGGGRFRFSVLNELGRIDDDELLRFVAREVCRQKLKAKDAIAMIRRVRLGGKEPAGDATDLANVIIDTINTYLRHRPSMTLETVLDALGIAEGMVDESLAKDE